MVAKKGREAINHDYQENKILYYIVSVIINLTFNILFLEIFNRDSSSSLLAKEKEFNKEKVERII